MLFISIMEIEKPKKITAGQVLKKYNLTANELDDLLDQIYTELEANHTSDLGDVDSVLAE